MFIIITDGCPEGSLSVPECLSWEFQECPWVFLWVPWVSQVVPEGSMRNLWVFMSIPIPKCSLSVLPFGPSTIFFRRSPYHIMNGPFWIEFPSPHLNQEYFDSKDFSFSAWRTQAVPSSALRTAHLRPRLRWLRRWRVRGRRRIWDDPVQISSLPRCLSDW